MSLSVNYSYFGNGNWSIDAVGGSATGGGVVEAIVPAGSTVEAAFLYQSRYSYNTTAAGVFFDGEAIGAAEFTHLGSNGDLDAFRTDVTAQVQAAIGAGGVDPYEFNISTNATEVDGYQLVVVYSNDNEAEQSIVLADGFSDSDGDDFSVAFPEAIDTTVEGFQALMSLGIGFGYQGVSQYSTVSVDGRLLTSSAGGFDDGYGANGGLITAGGIGDDPENPVDPFALPADSFTDDELYDLAQGNGVDANPFLSNGATSIFVETENPSNDDNIFFVGFNITGEAVADTDENDRPDARDDDYGVVYSRSLFSLDVLANDVDADVDDVLSITGYDDSATVGAVTMNPDGTFDYVPVYGFVGTDTFTYEIWDGELADTATVTIDVECPVLIVDRAGLDYLEGCIGPNIMRGLRGDDYILGRSGQDEIYGNDGNDELFGEEGRDYVNGGFGEDSIDGGEANDVLIGGWHADTLMLGEGSDRLRGGGSDLGGDGYADVFVLDTLNNGTDVIQDFEIGLDMIDLNGAAYEVSYRPDRVVIDIEDGGSIALAGVTADEYNSVDTIFV
ncbi:calcium-binding protein [Phaeobacter marinintestinus]|uniref:calcium-binding protein n=1 Tax=Falsiphaeobacter marinintestinus TaxID=1492905 RepID=UPI0011B59764|nr:cadherin-like domain-containing protein [Phaeobacter marinintestinus]